MLRIPALRRRLIQMLACWGLALTPLFAHAQETDPNRVYRCPDNSYTNMLSVVKSKNCKPVDNANVSVMSPAGPSAKKPTPATRGASGADRVSATTQKERDAEARRILDAELQSQQLKLEGLLKAYNNGHPDYLGNEHNVGGGINQQKYLDRVAAMKNQITLTEANIQALQRELQRYGP